MPGFLVSAWQMQTLLDLCGIDAPRPGSPLRAVRPMPRKLQPGDGDWEPMAAQGLVVRADGGWRANSAVASVLAACSAPQEVIDVGTTDPDGAGFTVIRRGQVVAECTVWRSGATKVFFPLERSTVIANLLGALSSDRPEPEAGGFSFVGPAEDAFVLGAALREHREDPAVRLTRERLRARVARDAENPRDVAGFAELAGPAVMEALAASSAMVDGAVAHLLAGGHLVETVDATDGRGVLRPSVIASEVLGRYPTYGFAVTHTEIAADGRPRRASMNATRCGPRTLVFRVRSRSGSVPEFEWVEVRREELRRLVAATVMTERERRILLDPQGADLPEATVRPVELRLKTVPDAPAPLAAAPPEAERAWQATHLVPPAGMRAWPRADPAADVIAVLDPGLPVQVDEWRGAWAHVVCSNGWSAWVDGRELQEHQR